MTRKEQLKNELDEMKGFIDACEIAIDYSLGLDKATYEKYEDAIKRRTEINDQLDQLAQRKPYGFMSGLFTSATMQRKVSEYPLDRCKIETLVILEHEDFENFRNNLLSDHDFIKENIDSMHVDSEGTMHCLLVLDEDSPNGTPDGILVESEGANYARYSSYLPNANFIVRAHIFTMVNLVTDQVRQNMDSRIWTCEYDEFADVLNMKVTEDGDVARIIIEALNERPDVENTYSDEDGIKVVFQDQAFSEDEDVGESMELTM